MEHLLYFFRRLQTFAGKILYVNLLAMVLVSFLQGMEIFLLLPLVNISGIMGANADFTVRLGIIQFLVDFLKMLGLPLILGIYILLVIGQSLLQRNITIRNVTIMQGFNLNLRFKTYSAILRSNWDFFIRKRKSDIINTLTTEMGRVGSGLNMSLQFITFLIFSLIQVGVAFWLSAELTFFVLVCGVIHMFMARRFVKRAKVLGNVSLEIAQSYLAGITDQLNGIKDIKSNTLEESRLIWLRKMTSKMWDEQAAYIELKANSELLLKVSSAVFISLFLFLSVTIFHSHPAQLLLVIMIFFRVWPRITVMQSSAQQIAACLPAFKVLAELEKECNEAREIREGGFNYKNVSPVRIEYGIECRNVFFRYNPKEPIYALQDISLHIPANRMIAIVGRSGAGKSTLIDVLMGLMQPERGEVLLDGSPLTEDKIMALRRSISYIPQDPFLFNASIRDNLLLIDPNASEEELWRALEFSVSAEFVKKFPRGLDTVIGDRGVRLSGGERQRLVLARAILRKPSILVLDEATSALDTENETKIQGVLDRLRGEITVIVIAHRLSTIRNADQVIVLDQGRVIQKGGFRQLAREKRGLFRNLLRNQTGAADITHNLTKQREGL